MAAQHKCANAQNAAPHPPPEAGFSLLELVVIIAIMSFALALVVPTKRAGSGQAAVNASAAKLGAVLRVAHAEALRTNADQFVLIDPDGRTYGFGVLQPADSVGAGIALSIEGDGLEWQGPLRRLRFRPDGTTTGATLVLEQANARSRIVVDDLTGAVKLTTGTAK